MPLPTPEQVAIENAHVNQMLKVQNTIKRIALADDEALLKDVFECSQLQFQVDTLTANHRAEIAEDAVEAAREDIEYDAKKEALRDAKRKMQLLIKTYQKKWPDVDWDEFESDMIYDLTY